MGDKHDSTTLKFESFWGHKDTKNLAFHMHLIARSQKWIGGFYMNTTMCFFMFLALVFSGKILAKEEVIATITNDENLEVYTFVAQTNDDTNSITAFFKDDYLNGKKTERELLPSQELIEGSGVVLEKRGSQTVINLKSDNFDLEQGGHVTIDTLYNGVSGERKAYDLQLSKSSEGWRLFRGDGIIKKLHIVTNKKFLLGTVGVKEIQMN